MNRVPAESRLADLELEPEYRSDIHDLVNDFYVPCLERSRLYRRAVGYFTSHGLSIAAQGISTLIEAGGHMHLVASPNFAPDDLEAIERGYKSREAVVSESLVRALDEAVGGPVGDRLGYLAWLIGQGRLDIKVAISIHDDGRPRRGLYHEKLGIFTDAVGDSVAFAGSSNETEGGLLDNFEANDVFWSWDDPQGRVARKVGHFERLWADRTAGLLVLPFPDAARERFLEIERSRPRTRTNANDSLWRHQREAADAFLRAERGVIEMATGTGKTRTALHLCKHLIESGEVRSIIVATDGNDLLDQWYGELIGLTQTMERSLSVFRHYGAHHDRDGFELDPERSILLSSRGALPPAMKSLTAEEAAKTLLIHDEVHRLGSPANRREMQSLSDDVRFRLGLSATPEREYDDVGNDFIEGHIGPVIYEFGLGDAIRRGILAPFDYHAIEYTPSAEDSERISQVYRRVAARKHAGNPMSKEEVWIELARVHKTSRAKLPLFEEFVRERQDLLERCIIFVETRDYGEDVLKIVHRYRHDFHTYFSGEEAATLERFARGELQCLLTCHRLSEGIDIRSLTTVILFSSARARLETIQRMGRCLRRDPSNPGKRATVVDFIRTSDQESDSELPRSDELRCEWLNELSQVRPEES